MKIKIHTGEDIVDLDGDVELFRLPVAGEQIRISIDKKPYKFDVSNVFWDFIEDEVIIEVT